MFNKKRISESNVIEYIKQTYGKAGLKTRKVINSIDPLLQSNYGGDMDCTLTSITTILNDGDPAALYNKVESVAKKYLYRENRGTSFLFIKCIFDKVSGKKTSRGYLKNIGYNWSKIKKNIDAKNPMILSMSNDGRDYYKNHSVTIIGYSEYNEGNVKMLIVYDNWYRSISYIDYNKLSLISCINYL